MINSCNGCVHIQQRKELLKFTTKTPENRLPAKKKHFSEWDPPSHFEGKEHICSWLKVIHVQGVWCDLVNVLAGSCGLK